VARALARVPAQARRPLPVDTAQAHAGRGGRGQGAPARGWPAGYLEHNAAALVHYAARRRRGEPIATSFVESAVGEIVAWRMSKAQQMRWSRATVQPFLDVRAAVLNDTLEPAFRRRHPDFRPANDDWKPTAVAA
jgi:hypothetical protein